MKGERRPEEGRRQDKKEEEVGQERSKERNEGDKERVGREMKRTKKNRRKEKRVVNRKEKAGQKREDTGRTLQKEWMACIFRQNSQGPHYQGEVPLAYMMALANPSNMGCQDQESNLGSRS